MRPNQIATATATVKVHTSPDVNSPQVSGLPDLTTGQIVTVLDTMTTDSTEWPSWAEVQDAYSGLSGYSVTNYLTIQTVTSPLFIPDLYHGDAGGKPDFTKLFLDPRYVGAILKVTQGTSSGYTNWFVEQWPKLAQAGGDALGTTWFRGAYHFLELVPPDGTSAADFGTQQANYYLSILQQAGGLTGSDLPPIVDVETAGGDQTGDVVDQIATAWANTVQAALGRKPMLYRRYNDGDWPGLKSQMGCSYLWAKRYSSSLGTVDNGFTSAALWQYTDGSADDVKYLPAGYPYNLPGIGAGDVSTFLYGAGTAADIQALVADSAV